MIYRLEEWYQITRGDFKNLGGEFMLKYYYDNYPMNLLAEMYPDVEWYPWKFTKISVPYGYLLMRGILTESI
jgi:hypothetical protein